MIRNANTTDLGFITLRPFGSPRFPPNTAFLDYFILASFVSVVLASDYLFDNSFPKKVVKALLMIMTNAHHVPSPGQALPRSMLRTNAWRSGSLLSARARAGATGFRAVVRPRWRDPGSISSLHLYSLWILQRRPTGCHTEDHWAVQREPSSGLGSYLLSSLSVLGQCLPSTTVDTPLPRPA